MYETKLLVPNTKLTNLPLTYIQFIYIYISGHSYGDLFLCRLLFVVAECLGWTTTLLLGVFLAVPTAAPGAQHGTTQSKILKITICAENPSFYGV